MSPTRDYSSVLKAPFPSTQNILVEEQEEKQLRMAEMEAQKLENRLKYQDEILSRPKRTWFISETDKEKQRDDSKQIEYKKGGIGPYSGDRDEEEGGRKKRKRDDVSSKSPKGMKLKPKLSNSKKKRKVTEEDKKMFGTQKAASNAMKKAPHSAKSAYKFQSNSRLQFYYYFFDVDPFRLPQLRTSKNQRRVVNWD
jgi:hypothetical protein